jgi:ribulose-phosphate 3-epimerase
VAAGADLITIHPESTIHAHRALQTLGTMKNHNDHARGIMRGIALNPGTPVAVVEPLLDEVDIVFLLAVNPGWGGQKFISATPARLEQVRALIERSGRHILTGLDGGITRGNIGEISKLGVDILVIGSAVFDGPESAKNARFMLHELRQGREQ